ncbi:MAG: hypothetical protein RLY86_2081 [Pseudomonadota bacterium]|jgi:SlyX protein
MGQTEPASPAGEIAELTRRVTELEIRLTHQDRVVEELSDVVAAQARSIDGLTTRLRLLIDRLRDMEAWRPSPTDDRPPPHY